MIQAVVDRRLANFRTFNEMGGKFRLSVTNLCNLRCFFCHNEAMGPVNAPIADPLPAAELVGVANAYAALGGRQINITGGEPLVDAGLPRLLEAIEKRGTRLVLNSNGLLHERLTRVPRIAAIDTILVSLHTLDDAVFRRDLGGRDTASVTRGILALAGHGYHVKINLSLGPHNAAGVGDVVDWAVANGIDLKVISLVRPTEAPGFYRGDWVDPAVVEARFDGVGRRGATREQLGGRITEWKAERSVLELKNIARGRLRTDFCDGCPHAASCGEGIYGLRIGVDGLAKPCLLRRERFRRLDRSAPWREQILDAIDGMIGDWTKARFETGAPA